MYPREAIGGRCFMLISNPWSSFLSWEFRTVSHFHSPFGIPVWAQNTELSLYLLDLQDLGFGLFTNQPGEISFHIDNAWDLSSHNRSYWEGRIIFYKAINSTLTAFVALMLLLTKEWWKTYENICLRRMFEFGCYLLLFVQPLLNQTHYLLCNICS